MNAFRYCAVPLAALALTFSAAAYAHEAAPSEKVTVLQDQMLKNVPNKKALMIEVDYLPGQSSIAHKHEGTALYGVSARRKSIDPFGKLIAVAPAINKQARIKNSGLFISRRN